MTDFWIEDVPVWKRWAVLALPIVVAFIAIGAAGGWLIETGPWCGLC